MMSMMPRIFIVCCVLAVVSLRAQSSEDTISIRFSCLAWDTTSANGIQYQNGDEVVTLRVGQEHLNGPYTYTGPSPLVFFRDVPGDEPGVTVRKPVASVSLDPLQTDVMLLFFPNKPSVESVSGKNSRELKVLVLENDFGSFPQGSFRIINLSQHDVGCILGNETLVIPGKQSRLITSPAKDEDDIRVHFSMKIDDQWEPKINTGWMYRANRRTLVFLSDFVNNRRPYLKLKAVNDTSSR